MEADNDFFDSSSPSLATTLSQLDCDDSIIFKVDVFLKNSFLDVSQQGDVMCQVLLIVMMFFFI